ncbi:hypothetical protein ACSBR2_015057 [Camellia fascicularis]
MVMKKTMGGSVCAVECVLVILALIASSVTVNATITCQDAILKILPCEPYLLGIGDITVPCCQGAQNLNQMVNSTADRRAVCACFKQVGPSLGVNVDRAKKLPDLCKIDLRGITIDFTIDCSTIPPSVILLQVLRFRVFDLAVSISVIGCFRGCFSCWWVCLSVAWKQSSVWCCRLELAQITFRPI